MAELLPVLTLAQLAEEMNADSGLVVPLSWHNWGLQLSLDFNKRQESSLSQHEEKGTSSATTMRERFHFV